MNTVSFETAKWLNEAGFPQSAPEFGQVWVGRNETLILGGIGKASKARHCLIDGHGSVLVDDFIVDRLVFAPAATDILKEIPFVSLSFEVYETSFEFRVWEGLKLIAKHENPHEAAAIAWLSIQEKNKN